MEQNTGEVTTPEAVDVGPPGLLWNAYRCPRCKRNVGLGIMSLRATCACGLFYAAVSEGRGWYESMEDYRAGKVFENTGEVNR